MREETIDRLRDKLHSLITEKADYNEILKVSQELDIYISEFTSKGLTSKIYKSTRKV